MTIREAPTTKRSWANISRKYSFNEDLFKASQVEEATTTTPNTKKSATLGAAAGSRLLRSTSFSNMLSKDDGALTGGSGGSTSPGAIGTLVGVILCSRSGSF